MRFVRRFYWWLLNLMGSLPTVLLFLRDKDVGGEYGIGFREKLRLLRSFRRNAGEIETLSTLLEHLELASAILRVPWSTEGDVIECGCYVGGSSVNLSLVCALVGRRLIVCDSFEGLPEPEEYDRAHFAVHTGHTDEYEKGLFAATLDVAKDNIGRFGDLASCDFIVGFFEESLRDLRTKVVVAFLDVDLIDSVKPCITAIWPNLQEGCRIYVHEARNLALSSVFFDAEWWQSALQVAPPGLVGAGSGLALRAIWGSELGYAQKTSRAEQQPV
jgi:hypothetical protein